MAEVKPLNGPVKAEEVSEVLTPQPTSEIAAKGRQWAEREKNDSAVIQMSLRIPVNLRNRLKKAIQQLDNGTTMTDVILQGIETELAAINTFLAKG